MEISKKFQLKFMSIDGFNKKFRIGEWIGLYQLKPRDNGTVVEPGMKLVSLELSFCFLFF